MTNIRILQGDITRASVSAIVNAANSRMLGGGGVDGAIHRAAGPKLLEACYQVPEVNGVRCPAGEARITPAGDLNADYVIHTVGPIYHSDPSPAETLASAYRSSLYLALENGCDSVAFPAISCGVYGYPLHEAAQISLDVCRESKFKDIDIYFYLFDHEINQVWQKAYGYSDE
ncbi:O-acetyl-ADP-ribose deacetylase [Vibrio sp. JC009]|uniref:O-acetyl-ADP-ribose deacetylase n=1 Tax=Vibrio sp. JC009 TaxID=2912314 RepID=UPI0023B191B6|nr:O-acetyl-ADP-ribose deacetylase [Vibrio sp. JC009]WED22834.1 O-acetyl-ADP-ribose deacetylase [Vibrio sp. JC009]